ncbi:MAG: hypothetical protein K5898_16165 [Ruminococcus sp.]|uniref:hypothetical protein n=1 Tax=Ruminococcus sp. TaxID=41978 RepID=UPI0025D7ED59|nr:hypothetical protein [Ruminococcus sp.]MCR4796675.1 hypothetical protein [Ruminococcus sp.]
MSYLRKRMIAAAAVACVMLTSAVSCMNSNKKETGNDSNSPTSATEDKTSPTLEHLDNEKGAVIVTPFQSGSPADLGLAEAPDAATPLDAADPTQPATEIVEVTEANGEKATDAQGQVVTQIVTKAAEDATSASPSNYVSKIDSRYCLWMDISKDKDFVFNDDFIEVYFKLKENIPEKDYGIRFNPDFSTIGGDSLKPDKIIQGNIRVGGDIEAQDVSSESGFVAYGDNVSAKPGEEVCYRINLKNNPGMAAMLVWIYYDSNAMEVEDVIPSGEFGKFASSASTGEKPKSN